MKIKIILTVLLLGILFLLPSVYHAFQGPIESEIAVRQLNDSVIDYAVSREISINYLLLRGCQFFIIFLMVTLWGRVLFNFLKKEYYSEKDIN